MEKKYYYLSGKERKGPFSIEELKTKEFTKETFIWCKGMDEWKKLKEIPRLLETIGEEAIPPPPPIEEVTKTEVSGEINVSNKKEPNPTLEAIKPNKNSLKWIIIWIGFHFFALLMSYSNVEIFNGSRNPEPENFWPIVEFYPCEENFHESEASKRRKQEWRRSNPGFGSSLKLEGEYKTECNFQGIFYEYDWSEFAFYIGGATIFFLVRRVSNTDEDET